MRVWVVSVGVGRAQHGQKVQAKAYDHARPTRRSHHTRPGHAARMRRAAAYTRKGSLGSDARMILKDTFCLRGGGMGPSTQAAMELRAKRSFERVRGSFGRHLWKGRLGVWIGDGLARRRPTLLGKAQHPSLLSHIE